MTSHGLDFGRADAVRASYICTRSPWGREHPWPEPSAGSAVSPEWFLVSRRADSPSAVVAVLLALPGRAVVGVDDGVVPFPYNDTDSVDVLRGHNAICRDREAGQPHLERLVADPCRRASPAFLGGQP